MSNDVDCLAKKQASDIGFENRKEVARQALYTVHGPSEAHSAAGYAFCIDGNYSPEFQTESAAWEAAYVDHLTNRGSTVSDHSNYALVGVIADWLPRGVTIPAYSNRMLWNGWAMPYFTIEAARSLLEHMPELRYDSDRDAFIHTDSDPHEEEAFSSVTICIDGKNITTYAIGAGCWCWSFAD